VAKLVSGKTRRQGGGNSCQWQGSTGDDLGVIVDVLSDDQQARGSFTTDVRNTEHEKVDEGTTATFLGTRTVTGVGDQATVLFEALTTAAFDGKHVNEADLIVRTRNAVIQVIRLTGTIDAARLPGPALVPGAAATAREVQAGMPTLGPGSPGVGVHISLDVSHPVGDLVILGEPGRGDQHRGIAE
jgi:hypothetical protein